MKLFRFISTYVLVFNLSLVHFHKCTVQSPGCPCTSTLFIEDVIANHILLGHVITSKVVADVGQCFHHCVYSSTACKSFNTWKDEGNRVWCEMNEQNKDDNPLALEAILGRDYYQVNTRVPSKPHFFKDCNCKHYVEFSCECQDGYLGNQCDRKARSCQDYFAFNHNYQSALYVIFDGNDTKLSVYCDMDIATLSAWTLVLSYAYRFNNKFNSTPFFVNNPLDEDNPNWSFYRLSLSRMRSIRSSADSWRASCDYVTYGIDNRDIAIARWTDIDLISLDTNGCYKFSYIDIRGFHCSNCTTWIHQGLRMSRMFLVAACYGQSKGCDLVAAPGCNLYEESFGYYNKISQQFRCTAGPNSTTQFWFGGKI